MPAYCQEEQDHPCGFVQAFVRARCDPVHVRKRLGGGAHGLRMRVRDPGQRLRSQPALPSVRMPLRMRKRSPARSLPWRGQALGLELVPMSLSGPTHLSRVSKWISV